MNPVQVINLDEQEDQNVYNYVKENLLASINPTEDQITNAYTNVQLWMDHKQVEKDRVDFLESNKSQALTIATGPSYEATVNKNESTSKASMLGSEKTKLAAVIALLAFGLWYVFKEQGSVE